MCLVKKRRVPLTLRRGFINFQQTMLNILCGRRPNSSIMISSKRDFFIHGDIPPKKVCLKTPLKRRKHAQTVSSPCVFLCGGHITCLRAHAAPNCTKCYCAGKTEFPDGKGFQALTSLIGFTLSLTLQHLLVFMLGL